MARQQESLTESASRLGRFTKSTQETKKKGEDVVKNIQSFAQKEIERKKKEEEEKKKKKSQVDTAPKEGFLTRMYKKYVSGEK